MEKIKKFMTLLPSTSRFVLKYFTD